MRTRSGSSHNVTFVSGHIDKFVSFESGGEGRFDHRLWRADERVYLSPNLATTSCLPHCHNKKSIFRSYGAIGGSAGIHVEQTN